MHLIAVLVLGSALVFGGAMWWFRPALAITVFLLVGTELAQSLAVGRMPMLKSPLGLLGMMVLGLGLVQLARCPPVWQAGSRPRPTMPMLVGSFPGWSTGTIPRRYCPIRCRFVPRQVSIGRQPCAGWSKRVPAWESSGPYLISPIAWEDFTWSGGLSSPRFC